MAGSVTVLAPLETATSFGSPMATPFETAGETLVSWLRRADVTGVIARIDRSLQENAVGSGEDQLPAGRTFVIRPPAPAPATAVQSAREQGPPGVSTLSAAHLDRCLADIQDWLGVGLRDAAQVAGTNRGTVYAWRQRGSNPRPGTVGAILRVHGVVASAVAAVGAERTKEWFHAGHPAPMEELLAARGQAAALSQVARRVRRSLAGPPAPAPNSLLAVTVDDAPSRPLV